jgi:hypothetical protein
MAESELGVSVAATRQKGGSPVSGLPVAGAKVPDVTISATVMVACGRATLASEAQGRAHTGRLESTIPATTMCQIPVKVSKAKVYSQEIVLENRGINTYGARSVCRATVKAASAAHT